MSDLELVERVIAAAWNPRDWADVTTIIGVSGGPDSVALLRASVNLFRAQRRPTGRLLVAHFHHRMRAAEANADADFVADLSRRLDLPYHQATAHRAACPGGDGLEAEARQQRYAFFRELAGQTGARYVATGHTADDQCETILHRIIRGTGLDGLAGIPAARPLSELTTIVRPLLAVGREAILGYLADLNQPYRVDSSNCRTDMTRNRIRHRLIPGLAEQYNPGITAAVIRLGRQAASALAVMDELVDPLWDEAVREIDQETVQLRCTVLAGRSPYLVCRLLTKVWKTHAWPMRDMGEAQWRRLASYIQGATVDAVAITLPGPVRARRDGVIVWLERGGGLKQKSS